MAGTEKITTNTIYSYTTGSGENDYTIDSRDEWKKFSIFWNQNKNNTEDFEEGAYELGLVLIKEVKDNHPDYLEMNEQEKSETRQAGRKVAQYLTCSTDDYERRSISNSLNTITKDNVMDFLDGYYNENLTGNRAGLIKRLDLRGRSKRATKDSNKPCVTMEQKINLIQALLAKAKECNLEREDEYVDIKEILVKYVNKDGANTSGRSRFNKNAYKAGFWENKHGKGALSWPIAGTGALAGGIGGAALGAAAIADGATGVVAALGFMGPVGWCIAGVVVIGFAAFAVARGFDHNKDNEMLDDAIEKLYTKIKGSQ